MKKYIIMASVAALAIGLSSCSNFLDELPDIVQCCHHLLCQPYILILIAHLNTVLLIAN